MNEQQPETAQVPLQGSAAELSEPLELLDDEEPDELLDDDDESDDSDDGGLLCCESLLVLLLLDSWLLLEANEELLSLLDELAELATDDDSLLDSLLA